MPYQLTRPPTNPQELHATVQTLFNINIPQQATCPGHTSPFQAFCEGYFGNPSNWTLWYGSRGCLAADTIITVNRATLSRQQTIRSYTERHHGKHHGGKPFDPTIPTYIQQHRNGHARLGLLADAYESGIKTTYQLTTHHGRTIRATAEHPFQTPDGTYTPLTELTTSTEILANVGKSTAGRTVKPRYRRRSVKHHPLKGAWDDAPLHRLIVEADMNNMPIDTYIHILNHSPDIAANLIALPADVHVHHIDRNPTNNRLANLMVLSTADHHALHAEEGTAANVWDRIDTDTVKDIRLWGEEPTYDLAMEGVNNYIANGLVVHNTGKSLMLALLGLTKTVLLGINTTLLGGSMAQSQNVHEHIENLMLAPNAPRQAINKQIQTELSLHEGNWIRPLPASQRTVRGPHPHMTLLDEIDEMDWDVYNAAQGQAMARPNTRGHIVPEMTVASSTWQNPEGTFSKVLRNAQTKKLPVHTWCWREVITPHGWMDPAFIQRKKLSVPNEMFRIEYELGEPAGDSLAFDHQALTKTFTEYPNNPQPRIRNTNDEEWTLEPHDPKGWYAAGVDWAKTVDKTIITIIRIDTNPWRLAYIRKLSRHSWPYMIDQFKQATDRYNATSAHDATGLGNVVGDLIDERTLKVVMVGKDRIQLLTEYITAIENGQYQLPQQIEWLYRDHRATTVHEVFAPAKWNSHLADSIASAAIAHRAATRQVQPTAAQIIKTKEDDLPLLDWQKQLNPPAANKHNELVAGRSEGVVEVIEDPGDVSIFWMP